MPQYVYSHIYHTHLYNWIAHLCTAVLNYCYSLSNSLYSTSLLLLGWFLWRTSIQRPCLLMIQLPYKGYRTCLTNHMGYILHHIMPPIINSLGDGCTHVCACIHTDVCMKAIIRNQTCAGLWLVHAWFKNFCNTHLSTGLNSLKIT